MTAAAPRLDVLRHQPSGAPARWRPVEQARAEAPAVPCPRRRVTTAGAVAAPSERHPSVVARRRRRQRVRRRRLVLALLSGASLVALALPWGGAGGHPLATPGPVLAGATVAPGSDYVVQPGDTMWSIARRLDAGGDPRATVAQLESQVGSDVLQPGEHLHLP
jgi:hypothetical protein